MTRENKIKWIEKLKVIEERVTELKRDAFASREEDESLRWLVDALAGMESYAWAIRDAVDRQPIPEMEPELLPLR